MKEQDLGIPSSVSSYFIRRKQGLPLWISVVGWLWARVMVLAKLVPFARFSCCNYNKDNSWRLS